MFLIHYAMRYSLFRPRKPRFCIILMQMYKLYARTPDPKRDDRAGVFSYIPKRAGAFPPTDPDTPTDTDRQGQGRGQDTGRPATGGHGQPDRGRPDRNDPRHTIRYC